MNITANSHRGTLLRLSAPLLFSLTLCPSAATAAELPNYPKMTRETSVVKIEEGKWTGPRLDDGQPDVQGHWSNTISNHSNLTNPQGGDPRRGGQQQAQRKDRAPSRVIDPPDGKVPFLPWAAEKQAELVANFNDPKEPQHVEPFARCAPGGPIKSFLWHGNEIRQYPGKVLILFDSGYRLITLDNPQHLPDNVKLWNGDSRGHWEGNTLVVDVANNNGKARLGRSAEFFSENARIQERYVFDKDVQRIYYTATITDPTVFSRPWTVAVPLRRVEKFHYDDWNNFLKPAKLVASAKPSAKSAAKADAEPLLEIYERQCVENNGGFGIAAGQ